MLLLRAHRLGGGLMSFGALMLRSDSILSAPSEAPRAWNIGGNRMLDLQRPSTPRF
jgi:hypothetical protein